MGNELAKNENNCINVIKDEYSIWNFLKEHTSLLIASVSALVAIFSFFFNLAIYLNVNSYLSFWEVSSSQINFNTSNQLYNVFLAFIFQILTLCTTFFISNTYEAYSQRQKIFILLKQELKTVKKNDKIICKELSKEKKRLLKLKRVSEDKNEINKQLEHIECIEKKNSINKERINNINESYKKCKKENIILLIISHVICFSLMFLGSLLFMMTAYADNIFLAAAIYAVGYVGLNILFYGIANCILVHRSIKKKNDDESDDCYENILEFKDLPIEKAFLGKKESIISNKVIKKIGVQLVFATIVFLWVFSYSGYNNAKKQEDFYYISNAEETFVVIYNNGEDLTLKKAYIDDEYLTVDLTTQKTISAKDIILYKKKFSRIEVIPIE